MTEYGFESLVILPPSHSFSRFLVYALPILTQCLTLEAHFGRNPSLSCVEIISKPPSFIYCDTEPYPYQSSFARLLKAVQTPSFTSISYQLCFAMFGSSLPVLCVRINKDIT